MDAKRKLWVGGALLAVGTALVFGLSAVDGMLLVALGAVASVAALTAGTLLAGTAEESV